MSGGLEDPSRYNDEREMTRYFSFEFIDGREVTADVDWLKKSEDIEADARCFQKHTEYNGVTHSNTGTRYNTQIRDALIQSTISLMLL